MEYVIENANLSSQKGARENLELIVKTALKKEQIPNELNIPEKIQKYVYLRELRHYIAHTSIGGNRDLKVKLINLHLDVDKFTETEFNNIKNIVNNIINLIGMSMCLINKERLS